MEGSQIHDTCEYTEQNYSICLYSICLIEREKRRDVANFRRLLCDNMNHIC